MQTCHEKPKGKPGEYPEGQDDPLLYAYGAAQQGPLLTWTHSWHKPKQEATPDQNQKGQLSHKVKLAAEMATYHDLLKDWQAGSVSDALDSTNSKSLLPTGLWMVK